MRWITALFFISFSLCAQPNLLINESSPYLRQHAHNPVQWYPWGKEALEKAKAQNKPIFLSIGYSTCHWCHVMNEESFEDNATAAFLNERFVCIKVDREERPDLDETYLLALSLMNAEKGWPLNIFLTPDAKPIFGSTYLSTERFNALARKLAEIWEKNPRILIDDAEKTYAMMERISSLNLQAGTLDASVNARAIADIAAQYDPENGGFGSAPKFPNEPWLLFLLSQNRPELSSLVEVSLEKMAHSALYDRLGGGFHRYATDAAWRAPHFEKMLYNQAQLSRIYALAYKRTKNPLFREIAAQTNDYVLRDMRSSDGLFFTAQDAGGKDAEGLYYLWTRSEIESLLSPSERSMAYALFGFDIPSEFSDRHPLLLTQNLGEYAKSHHITLQEAQRLYASLRSKLLKERSKRLPLHRDEKSITSYNAMMIDSLAETSRILGDKRYLDAALKASETLWKHHRSAEGTLYRSSYGLQRSGEGLLDDYAHFALAMLRLYEITGRNLWLKRSKTLADEMIRHFHDPQNGGFYLNRSTTLSPLRPKEISDRYTPSANASALQLLKKLSDLTGSETYKTIYTQSLGVFAPLIRQNPSAYTSILSTLSQTPPKRLESTKPLTRFGARGAIRADLRKRSDTEYTLTLDLRSPWHINTHRVRDATLRPTSVTIAGEGLKLIGVRYPKGVKKKMGSLGKNLTLYEGKVTLPILVKSLSSKGKAMLILEFQACSDTTCLAPETLTFPIR